MKLVFLVSKLVLINLSENRGYPSFFCEFNEGGLILIQLYSWNSFNGILIIKHLIIKYLIIFRAFYTAKLRFLKTQKNTYLEVFLRHSDKVLNHYELHLPCARTHDSPAATGVF